MMTQLFIMILLFGGMWFLLIAPRKKRQREHRDMVAALKAGDEVLTNGGIYGTVVKVKDDRVVLRVADDVRIELNKAFVQNKISPASK